MTARLENASARLADLARIAEHAGATGYVFDPLLDVMDCEGIDQAQLDNAIATLPPLMPTADDVRAEASRRMQALVGARDAGHLEIIIANATREAVRLLRKGQDNWSPEEAARAGALEAVDGMVEHIRARSNAMELSPPADFADDRHWS